MGCQSPESEVTKESGCCSGTSETEECTETPYRVV